MCIRDSAKDVQAEIEFVLAREDVANVLTHCNLPIRVTHNDTKLNNVMIDDKDVYKRQVHGHASGVETGAEQD